MEIPVRLCVIVSTAIIVLLTLPLDVHGQDRPFCDGFSEGWKTVKGELTIVPICPIPPITPIGSTAYREGLKAGMSAAQRVGGGNSGGATSRSRPGDFCEGFSEGWKTIKGELTIVPICPIPPITPIGSTAYREGLKAGMSAARRR